MNPTELQSWLANDGIRTELDIITRLTVAQEIDNLRQDSRLPGIGDVDWARLLLAGSILARSERRVHQDVALRIATAAISLATRQAVRDAGAVLLGKLSNFRAISLATRRNMVQVDLEARLGVALRMEAQRREMDRSVLVDSTGAWLQVNEFQKRFWMAATEKTGWLSASAPTASGKTFLVLQWLIDAISTSDAKVAVYLAPTRALVSEIESSLRAMLGKGGSITVSSLPLPDAYEAARSGSPRVILVFTQERLHLLANALPSDLKIDLLVIDEAHKIGDNQRGVILQEALERAIRGNSSTRVVFISPATENPEELLTDAPDGVITATVDSDMPTVLQNILLARQLPGKPKLWKLSVVQFGSELELGTLQLENNPSSVKKRLAFVAAAVGERGGTLVYANGAAESEDIAHLISQHYPKPDSVDTELAQVADLARKGVHPHFSLAPLVERGVAFHFGNMPSLLRLEIERLFRIGKLRFLVCTSTLIEGVNLSCRTIVLRGPRKGQGNPMDPHDFWNLAGRAGRWGDEFQGNIVCVDTDQTNVWPTGVPTRARFPIKRESDAILERGEEVTAYLSERASSDASALRKRNQYEQVGAYLLTSYMRFGTIQNANLSKRHDAVTLSKVDDALHQLTSQIDIPLSLAARHPGVSAFGLQRLLSEFRAYEKDPDNLLPADVGSVDSFDRFVTIMIRINRCVFPVFEPESRVPVFALVVVQWLKGFSLARIIQANIDWHNEVKKSFRLPELIRDTMELVERVARFLAPKYLAAYVDVLRLHFREIGREDLIEDGLDIGTQLEFGISSRTLLSLIELGLSRMSAVAIYEHIADDELTKEGCIAWVTERREHLLGVGIPAIILSEVFDHLLHAPDRSA